MPSLLRANVEPVSDETRCVQSGGADFRLESERHVKSKVDGVQFDMGERVQESGPAVLAAKAPFRHRLRRQQDRAIGPGWPTGRRHG